MKIQRLMLAVLAVCGTSAALAQSSVSIYGRLNTSIERQKIGDQSTTGMFNNASRIGFKGVEDLGGGLKAGFQLEAGFGSDDGSGPLNFKRQSELNLSGNFGMLRLGRWTAESYYAVADYGVLDEPNHDTGFFSDQLYSYLMRDDNKIAYRTPVIGGFTLEGAASFHERAAGTNNKTAYDLAANWESGPLALGAAYTQLGDAKQYGLRAHYTFGDFQIGGYYQRTDDVGFGSTAIGEPSFGIVSQNAGKRNLFRLTGGYTFGASQIAVGYGQAGNLGGRSDTGARQFILGYNYNLSKRTKVYAAYTKVNNKDNATYGGVTTAGDNASSFGVGIRHNF
ncbi:porin [Comamonas terrigena]|uniref:porin n=1 Tax=Comamonas terrigena TaxID=32013 RepID=UPI0028A1F4B3|nr:porin [Comamonas terrigena]